MPNKMSLTVSTCQAQMPQATLSAWRDHELSGELAQRVQAHVQQCHACQDYLADLDAGGRAVRRDEAPQLQDAIWGDVRGRITPTGAGKRRATNARLPIIAGGLAATALLVTI